MSGLGAEKSKTVLVKIGKVGEVLQDVGDKISNAGEKLFPVTAGVTALGTAAVKTTSDFNSGNVKGCRCFWCDRRGLTGSP